MVPLTSLRFEPPFRRLSFLGRRFQTCPEDLARLHACGCVDQAEAFIVGRLATAEQP